MKTSPNNAVKATGYRRLTADVATDQPLPDELRDHKLTGNYHGRRECHLAGDWLLIYKL